MDQVEHHLVGSIMNISPSGPFLPRVAGLFMPRVVGSSMPDPFVADAFVLGMPAWVLALIDCVIMSFFVVCGFVLQKQALTSSASGDHRRIGDIVLSGRWLLGFSLVSLSPIIGDLVAYGLAPMSLITPLCGISVALNLCVAPWLLGERLQLRVDLTATSLIMIGMIMTSAVGPKKEINYSPTELLQLCKKPEFLAALSLLLLALSGCIAAMWLKRERMAQEAELNPSSPNMWHVVMVAFAASGPGAISNILLKTISEMIAQNHWLECLAPIVLLAPAAVSQLNFINRGLRHYPLTVFFPIYNTLLVFGNTTCGAIYFQEFKILFRHWVNTAVFLLGILFVSAGILCFACRGIGITDTVGSSISSQTNQAQTNQQSLRESLRAEQASVQCVDLATSVAEQT